MIRRARRHRGQSSAGSPNSSAPRADVTVSYEALDFSAEPIAEGDSRWLHPSCDTYMAHHQGMTHRSRSPTSCSDGETAPSLGHRVQRASSQAVGAPCLQETCASATCTCCTRARVRTRCRTRAQRRAGGGTCSSAIVPFACTRASPTTQLAVERPLFSVDDAPRPASGYSHWRDGRGMTRWREDATCATAARKLPLTSAGTGPAAQVWSAGSRSTVCAEPAAHYESRASHEDRVRIDAHLTPLIETTLEHHRGSAPRTTCRDPPA